MKTNPLNIRKSNDIFLGELKSTGEFKVFINRTYGVRAAFKIISNYSIIHGIDFTVSNIIKRWAPPTENDTSSYIKFVCHNRKILTPDTQISTMEQFMLLVQRMSVFESNIHLTNKCLFDAWNLAFPNTVGSLLRYD